MILDSNRHQPEIWRGLIEQLRPMFELGEVSEQELCQLARRALDALNARHANYSLLPQRDW